MKYYAFVKHSFPDTPLSFAKGLLAKLADKELPVEPYTSYFSVAPGKTEEDVEEFLTHGELWGQLGHCYDLIYWASGGLYWGDEIKAQKEKGFFNGPEEFTTQIWEQTDNYNLRTVSEITFRGIKWQHVSHMGVDSGASDCWGVASFTFDKKVKNENYRPMKCVIPTNVNYPSLYYGRLLMEHAVVL